MPIKKDSNRIGLKKTPEKLESFPRTERQISYMENGYGMEGQGRTYITQMQVNSVGENVPKDLVLVFYKKYSSITV